MEKLTIFEIEIYWFCKTAQQDITRTNHRIRGSTLSQFNCQIMLNAHNAFCNGDTTQVEKQNQTKIVIEVKEHAFLSYRSNVLKLLNLQYSGVFGCYLLGENSRLEKISCLIKRIENLMYKLVT